MEINANKETTEEFVGRLVTTVGAGCVSSGISFGLQTGLLKAMVDFDSAPKSSLEIAEAAGLKERYVREWLGAMVCSDIIELDKESERYYLPSHRFPAFCEGTEASGVAALIKVWHAILCGSYVEMVDVIKKDGPAGISGTNYKLFQDCFADFSKHWFANHLCQTFLPTHPVLLKGLEQGIRVLDVGCGRGEAAKNFALHFPKSSVIGLDIDENTIQRANENAKAAGLSNVEYLVGDASALPADWSDSFDYVFVFDAIHDMPRSDLVLAEIRRVMKPGAFFSCFEPNLRTKHGDNIGTPNAPIFYMASLFYCLPTSSNSPGSLALGAAWGREQAVKFIENSGLSVLAIEKQAGAGEDTMHLWCTLEK